MVDGALNALSLVLEHVVEVSPAWLAAGTLLFVISQLVRTRGWFTIVRAACPQAARVRARDVTGAYLVGAGLNGFLPARAGDVVKLWLLHRRDPHRARWAPLGGTLVSETLFETVCGVALVAWALSQGLLPLPPAGVELPTLDVSLLLRHPILSAGVAAGLAAVAVLAWRRWAPRVRAVAAGVREGFAILRTPRVYLVGVVSWQALSRVIRLGALAAWMLAFGLPVTAASVLLVMAAQGGGRIVPLAPVSAGLRLAMLTYGFAQVTGQAVDVGRILAFTAGVGAVQLVVLVLLGGASLAAMLGTSPLRALATVRALAAERAG